MRVRTSRAIPLFFIAILFGCFGTSSFGAIYPPRPPESPGDPIADPAPSRIVAHITVGSAALKQALEEKLPKTGEGTFPMLSSRRKFTWKRDPASLEFSEGRIGVLVHVVALADLPLKNLEIPLDLGIWAEPVINSDYVAKLQSIKVKVDSKDRVVK